jgi:hypothetical protein
LGRSMNGRSQMVSPQKRGLDPTWLRALALLITIPDGITDDFLMFAHGFDRAVIAGLVDKGPRNGTKRHDRRSR